MNWMHVTLGTVLWRAFVNTVMNLGVPQKATNS
jgi:hypothetical protein